MPIARYTSRLSAGSANQGLRSVGRRDRWNLLIALILLGHFARLFSNLAFEFEYFARIAYGNFKAENRF
jgi:hypothetical protein